MDWLQRFSSVSVQFTFGKSSKKYSKHQPFGLIHWVGFLIYDLESESKWTRTTQIIQKIQPRALYSEVIMIYFGNRLLALVHFLPLLICLPFPCFKHTLLQSNSLTMAIFVKMIIISMWYKKSYVKQVLWRLVASRMCFTQIRTASLQASMHDSFRVSSFS